MDDVVPVLHTATEWVRSTTVSVEARPGLVVCLAEMVTSNAKTVVNYVLSSDLGKLRLSPAELFEVAFRNLRGSLKVSVRQWPDGLEERVLHHPSGIGAAAVALPDIYENAAEWLGRADIIVGVPDPGHVVVLPDTPPARGYFTGVLESVVGDWAVDLDPCWFRVVNDQWTAIPVPRRPSPPR